MKPPGAKGRARSIAKDRPFELILAVAAVGSSVAAIASSVLAMNSLKFGSRGEIFKAQLAVCIDTIEVHDQVSSLAITIRERVEHAPELSYSQREYYQDQSDYAHGLFDLGDKVQKLDLISNGRANNALEPGLLSMRGNLSKQSNGQDYINNNMNAEAWSKIVERNKAARRDLELFCKAELARYAGRW